MPFANYHAARLKDPGEFEMFRYKRDALGDGVDAVYGISGGKTELQSIRFKADKFTSAEARAWLREHEFKPILFEEASA